MRRRTAQSITASPVLVGAVTVLVALVAVYLAYNANAGLPFVPTYDVRAQIPGGSNLVEANEVRIGGFRAGAVDRIRPGIARPGRRAGGQDRDARSVAVIEMKLDKRFQPIARDSRIQIRPRSALGLKYVDLVPGRSRAKLPPGGMLPLAQSLKPVELDDFFSTFNDDFRVNQRTVFEGYGNALAGRGQDINVVIQDAVPFLRKLEPVMRTLSDDGTELNNFFRQAGRTSAQLAPVAATYADLFVNMGTTFEALSASETRLRQTVERLAPTAEEGIRSFPVQRPFLRDSAELARRLEPVAEQIEESLPVTGAALRTGTPVLTKAPPFYRRTREVFRSLDELTENPNTLLALRDLYSTVQVTTPLIEHVAPYQTVCNYWNYYWTAISEHVSEEVRGGTAQRTNLKSDNRTQDNRLSDTTADKPVSPPAGQDPITGRTPNGEPWQALRRPAYQPAIDAQGNADCQVGQGGYPRGSLTTGNRYGPDEDGGRAVRLDGDVPGLSGGTFKSRELGIDNLRDVP